MTVDLLFSDVIQKLLCVELFAVMFMRANIVGTVIILSLIVWIPASCVVAYIVSTRYNTHCHYFAVLRS